MRVYPRRRTAKPIAISYALVVDIASKIVDHRFRSCYMIRMGKRGPDKQFDTIIRLPAKSEWRDAAKTLAEQDGVSLSEFIRRAVSAVIAARLRRRRQPSD